MHREIGLRHRDVDVKGVGDPVHLRQTEHQARGVAAEAWARRPKTAFTTSVTPGGWRLGVERYRYGLRFTIQQSQSPGTGACEDAGAALGLNAESAY